MKPRHAKQIRAGILAARQLRTGSLRLLLALSDLGAEAFDRELPKVRKRQENPARRPPEAGETFTHTTTPTAADKAAGDESARFKGEQ